MEAQVQNETTFFRDNNVVVTQSRYVTNSKTYAMRNISSVHVFEIIKSKRLPTVLGAIGLVVLIGSESKILGVVMMAIAIALFFSIKNDYAVRISTNSGESNSLISKDEIYIRKIVSALNDAIVHRG